MRRRRVITPARLYAILDREFRKKRPSECLQCRVPLPFRKDPPDDVSANWNIGTPRECPYQCQRIIAELVAQLWTEYEIEEAAGID